MKQRDRRQGAPFEPGIHIPQGWREEYIDRSPLPQDPQPPPPIPWVDRFQFALTMGPTRFVAANYVAILRRVEAGVFGHVALPKPPPPPPPVPQDLGQVSQIDQHHWWSWDSDAHPPDVGVPAKMDWELRVIRTRRLPSSDEPPPQGTLLAALTMEQLEANLRGSVEYLRPKSRSGAVEWSSHLVVPGPAWYGLVAVHQQPPPGTLRWAFARSWFIMAGVDYRYDSPTARRVLEAGFP